LKRCAKLANTCTGQSIAHLSLFFKILDSYLYFTKQKQIIQDKDDAFTQIVELIETKLGEEVEGEENKASLAENRQKWAEISHKYK
jgi:hypothetical protein